MQPVSIRCTATSVLVNEDISFRVCLDIRNTRNEDKKNASMRFQCTDNSGLAARRQIPRVSKVTAQHEKGCCP
jgi:hypothetical protein